MGKNEESNDLSGSCHICGKEVHGQLVSSDAENVALAREDLEGYRCTSCGVAYCEHCACRNVFRLLHRSRCTACGASAGDAQYVMRRIPTLMELWGYMEDVDAGDYGGSVRHEPTLISLHADSVRMVRQISGYGPRGATVVPLDEIGEIEIVPPTGEESRGKMLIKSNKGGWVWRLLTGKHKILFDDCDREAFKQFAERVRHAVDNHDHKSKGGVRNGTRTEHATPGIPTRKPESVTALQLELLEKLAKMHDKGIITEEEFREKKKDISGHMNGKL